MKEKRYVCNETGRCPICGEQALDWGCSEFQDDYVGYNWICGNCKAEGIEWYKMIFDGHEVQEKTQTEEGYDEYNWDCVNDYIAPSE